MYLTIIYTKYIKTTIIISPEASIGDLKSIISDKFGIPSENQILRYKGNTISLSDNDKVVPSLNIPTDSDEISINFHIKMCDKPPQFTVKTFFESEASRLYLLIYAYTPNHLYLPLDVIKLILRFYPIDFRPLSYSLNDHWDRYDKVKWSRHDLYRTRSMYKLNLSAEECSKSNIDIKDNVFRRGNCVYDKFAFGHQLLSYKNNKNMAMLWRFRTLSKGISCTKIGIVDSRYVCFTDQSLEFIDKKYDPYEYMFTVADNWYAYDNDGKWNQENIKSEMCFMLDWRAKALFMSFNKKPFEKVKEIDATKEYKLAVQIPWNDESERRLQMFGSVCFDSALYL